VIKVLKRVLLALLVALVAGCASMVKYKDYTVPSNQPIAKVNFVASDKFHNNDRVELSLLSRKSCNDKFVLAKVTWVGTKDFYGEGGFYKAVTELPTNERINLHVSNDSNSTYGEAFCSAAGSVVLEDGKQYTIKVNNWSKDKAKSFGFGDGLGCKFEVIEVDKSGKEISPVKVDDAKLPDCAPEGEAACSSSWSNESFPVKGAKKSIHATFRLANDGKVQRFDETAECEYHGAFCGGGEWFQVWYGDKSRQADVILLSNGDKLSFNAHDQCTLINEYRKDCSEGQCVPADKFGVLILFSKKRIEMRKRQIRSGQLVKGPDEFYVSPDRDFVSFSKLKEIENGVDEVGVDITDK
jgi:hypothetical protein